MPLDAALGSQKEALYPKHEGWASKMMIWPFKKEGFFTQSVHRPCSPRGKTWMVFIPQPGMSLSSLMGPALSMGLGWKLLDVLI